VAFAIVDRSWDRIASVLMILDAKGEAEAIASELREKDLDVRVVEFVLTARPTDARESSP